jgi:hypothetical protein
MYNPELGMRWKNGVQLGTTLQIIFLILKKLMKNKFMKNISSNEGTDKANPKLGVKLLAGHFR